MISLVFAAQLIIPILGTSNIGKVQIPTGIRDDKFTETCKWNPVYPNYYSQCSHDCEVIQFCRNGITTYVNCSAQTGKKYCDISTNTCADKIDFCYNSQHYCPNDGIFPDLTNCHKYVHCLGSKVYHFKCEHDTVYDYKTGKCLKDISCNTYTGQTGCSRDNSNSPSDIAIKHQNPRWYIFCSMGKPLLAECEGLSYTFDEAAGHCRFQCGVLDHAIGKHADEFDLTVYYECYHLGPKWDTIRNKCPEGMIFSEQAESCIEESNSFDESDPINGYGNLLEKVKNSTTNTKYPVTSSKPKNMTKENDNEKERQQTKKNIKENHNFVTKNVGSGINITIPEKGYEMEEQYEKK